MITSKSNMVGKFIYVSRGIRNRLVHVSRFPEEADSFRIVFTHNGEVEKFSWNLDSRDAEILWAALNECAKEMGWEDYLDAKP